MKALEVIGKVAGMYVAAAVCAVAVPVAMLVPVMLVVSGIQWVVGTPAGQCVGLFGLVFGGICWAAWSSEKR